MQQAAPGVLASAPPRSADPTAAAAAAERRAQRLSGGIDFEEEWHKIADQLEEVSLSRFCPVHETQLSLKVLCRVY